MKVSYGYELYDVTIQCDGNVKLMSTSKRTTSKSITQSVSGSATFELLNILHDDSNWIVTSSSPHRLALGRTTAVAIQCTCLFKNSSRVSVTNSSQPLDRCLKYITAICCPILNNVDWLISPMLTVSRIASYLADSRYRSSGNLAL